MRETLRLEILKILAEQKGYMASEGVVLQLLADRGHRLTRDALMVESNWLEEIAEVIIVNHTPAVAVMRLANDGLEHLQGARIIPGIRKPGPDELL